MPPTHVQSRVWTPCPDCAPFHIRSSVDALDLAVGWPMLPPFGLMLALLDAAKRVEALVLDPGSEALMDPDRIERPGLPRAVRGVALFSGNPEADDDIEPGFSLTVFASLRRRYREAGIQLVDWVQIDFFEDLYRSMQSTARDVRGTTADYLRAGTCR
jgi:hypothetical protein